jgi:hypothetical protein
MVWVNIIAVIVAPIVAVVIWQKLQDRTEKHFYFYFADYYQSESKENQLDSELLQQ